MSHVKAGGTAKNVHNNAGQRLGVKRFGGQKVKNGEVLVRQTGATKIAGPGTYMSRNFTIHATKYGLSKEIYTKRKEQSDELLKMRKKIYMDVAIEEDPEYVAELEQLKSNREVTYYFHGSDSGKTSQKINEQGLYMQYGDMDRTAVSGLGPYELLNYSYGHEGVGRHAITIIAVPKGEYVIETNKENVEVVGTGQGLAGINSFVPKYVIPKRYIYGYIDKDNKRIVKNSEYLGFGKKETLA